MSARERAARLVRRIERAIERGEFVPDTTYFRRDMRWGPCGCAVAAVEYLRAPLSRPEELALEAGYERFSTGSWSGHGRSPFHRAGRQLRKFNPRFESVTP